MKTLFLIVTCMFASPAWAQSDCWPNCPQDQTYRDAIWADTLQQRAPLPSVRLMSPPIDTYEPAPMTFSFPPVDIGHIENHCSDAIGTLECY